MDSSISSVKIFNPELVKTFENEFDQLNVTLIVAIVKFDAVINILSLFPLLEWTKIEIPESYKRKKKYKLLWPGEAGHIMRIQHESGSRGVNRSNGAFRNSITIDLSVSTKNISIKLSSSSMHICGANSDKMVIEGASILLNKIKTIQEHLNYMQANKEKTISTLNWVLEHTKADPIFVIDNTNEICNKIDRKSETNENGLVGYTINPLTGDEKPVYRTYQVVVPTICEESDLVDSRIAKFLIRMTMDYARHDFYELHLNWVINLDRIYNIQPSLGLFKTYDSSNEADPESPTMYDSYNSSSSSSSSSSTATPDLKYAQTIGSSSTPQLCKELPEYLNEEIKIVQLLKSMVNHNYNLGFHIDRRKLDQYVQTEQPNGFRSRYTNIKDTYVTINLYEKKPVDFEHRISRKKMIIQHSFLVYESGIITQSGPCEEMNRRAYILFNDMIATIRPQIELPFSATEHPPPLVKPLRLREDREHLPLNKMIIVSNANTMTIDTDEQ